jgi:hypothetical protein
MISPKPAPASIITSWRILKKRKSREKTSITSGSISLLNNPNSTEIVADDVIIASVTDRDAKAASRRSLPDSRPKHCLTVRLNSRRASRS